MLDKKKSLVICLTPLQMIIAEKVVAKQPSVDLLVIALNDNNKYKYYFDNFQHPNLKKQYYLFDNNQSIFSKILKVVKFKNFFEINDYYENVYISSIDNKYIHSILSKVKFDNLYTYDD
ncbi:polysaccharide biosynthesis protein, partial [Acinetobacter baumannii]|nr:polysaccharide biosynthesis protein [Acinetobacter baumannii]